MQTASQQGFTLWMTGLSGAGKTTIAVALTKLLNERGILIERLDGDVVRESLTKDLGFSKEDRDKNIERVTFVAKLLTRNNVVVLTAFISPYKKTRDYSRHEIGEFLEVYVRTPMNVLLERDVKGLYKKAMAGEIQNFTGVNDPYEEPANPDLVLDTADETIEESAAKVIALLEDRGYIPRQAATDAPTVTARDRVDGARLAVQSKRAPGPSTPHGGMLVDRELTGDARTDARERARSLRAFHLDERE